MLIAVAMQFGKELVAARLELVQMAAAAAAAAGLVVVVALAGGGDDAPYGADQVVDGRAHGPLVDEELVGRAEVALDLLVYVHSVLVHVHVVEALVVAAQLALVVVGGGGGTALFGCQLRSELLALAAQLDVLGHQARAFGLGASHADRRRRGRVQHGRVAAVAAAAVLLDGGALG